MRFAILALLIFSCPSPVFSQEAVRRFISFDGIGELKLCSSYENSSWQCLKDSSSQGMGFEFFGKYFINVHGGLVLSQISLIDSASIIQLTTSSSDFETYEGIKVGSTLEYLVSKFPDCYLTYTNSKIPAMYFSLERSSRRLKFTVDPKIKKEFSHLNLKEHQRASEVSGLTEVLKRLGNRAVVKEISVLLIGICYTN